MPRSSRSSGGGRSSSSRSAPAPAARSAAPPAARQAAPPAQQQQPYSSVPATMPQSQGPGMMGQIAANAASIAVGHTMARGIGNALGWNGSSQQPAEAAAAPQSVQAPYDQNQGYAQQQQQQQAPNACENIAKDFANCLTATKGDAAPCQYYLDQFKACQAAAAPY